MAILARLQARRFFRPLFRVLPNVAGTPIDAKPWRVAKVFGDATKRYEAERTIEKNCVPPLPLGTIVIHCPKETTAAKVANVLIRGTDAGGIDKIRKLRHVDEIDEVIFGEHKNAIRAVESMYRSMWRLVVYVSPQYLSRYEQIAQVVGKVIPNTLEKDYSGRPWTNDPNLEREMEMRLAEQKTDSLYDAAADSQSHVDPREKIVSQAIHELAEELEIPSLQRTLADSASDKDAIKAVISWIVQNQPVKEIRANGEAREQDLLQILNPLKGRGLRPEMVAAVTGWGQKELPSLTDTEFGVFRDHVERIVRFTPRELYGSNAARRTGSEGETEEVVAVLGEALRTTRRRLESK